MNLKNDAYIDELFKLSDEYKRTQDNNVIKKMYKLFVANNTPPNLSQFYSDSKPEYPPVPAYPPVPEYA